MTTDAPGSAALAGASQETTAATHGRLNYADLRLLWHVRTGPGPWRARWFALQQRLIGLGGGSATQARAWYRRYEWAQHRRRLGTVGTLVAWLKTPARLVRDAWRGTETYAAAVAETHGVSVTKQRMHLLWLSLRYGLDAYSYYSLWLYHKERRRRAGGYLQRQEAALVYRLLAVRDAFDDFLITDDKSRFETWCREQNLPTPAILGVVQYGALVASVAGTHTLPECDLFSKPVDSFGGAGGRRWHRIGPATWRGDDGHEYDAAALIAVLAAQSRNGRILLQECITNHPAIAHLSSGAVCTVRLITARPPDGEPEVVSTLFRMATGGHSTDNFSIAGVGAAVDLVTGELGRGLQLDKRLMVIERTRHPDTGATIPGFKLPLWDEARALAVEAHRRLPWLPIVGWDVALTPRGPILIEANWAPSPNIMQLSAGVPFGDTNFMRYLDAHLRRSFAKPAN